MPTVAELKNQIAAIESTLPALKATAASAQTKLDQAQAALTANLAAVPRVSLSQLIAAQKASATDPTNAALKQSYQTMQGQWDAQQAIYLPLLAARDAASTALISARVPLVDAETSIGDLQVQIVQMDPAQSGAYPEATAYLAEQNHTVPATSNPSPVSVAATSTVTSPAPPAAVANQDIPVDPPVVTSPTPPAEQPASEQTTPQATNEISAAQVVPLVNEGNAGEDAAAANVGIIKSIDVTGIDEQIAANAAADAVIADQVAALSEQNLETPPDLMAEAIQAQQEADQDYAFSTGYNNVQDQKDAENQQALDQIEADQLAADEQAANEAASELTRESRRGLTSEKAEAQSKANAQDISNFQAKEDWRVRLSLSPGANYLYKVGWGNAGILNPLQDTDGVLFPYTPNITVADRRAHV